jgi:hypothetical protein
MSRTQREEPRRPAPVRDLTRTPDGRQIIVREQAVGPCPNPSLKGKLVPFTGVNKILLDDDTQLFECNECGDARAKIGSVVAHLNLHTGNKREPLYQLDVIRKVLHAVDAARVQKIKSYCETAAATLNAQGITTYRGKRWYADDVSRVYRSWKDKVRIRNTRPTPTKAPPRAARPQTRVAARSTPAGTVVRLVDTYVDVLADRQAIINRLAGVVTTLDHFARSLQSPPLIESVTELRVGLAELEKLSAPSADPTLVTDAEKWRAFVAARDAR